MALKLEPQHISETTWYYEEKKGIEVIHEIKDARGNYIRTDRIMIPWHKLKASLKRKEAGE